MFCAIEEESDYLEKIHKHTQNTYKITYETEFIHEFGFTFSFAK